MVSKINRFSVYQSMQGKLPVAGFLYTKVCEESCQWQLFCIDFIGESNYTIKIWNNSNILAYLPEIPV